MLLPLLALLQLAAAPRPPLVVRAADGSERRLAIREDVHGAFVRADQLAEALGGRVDLTAGRWVLRVRGLAIDVREEVPFVRGDGRELPLRSAPMAEAGRLWVPLQLATDVLPRLSTGLAMVEAGAVLRVAGVESRRVAAAPTTPAPDVRADEEADEPATVLPTIRGRRASAPRAPVRPGAPAARSRASSDVGAVPPAGVRRQHTVVVDAGHGGPDGGMTSRSPGAPVVVEKTVTLGVAQALREALDARGIGVVMTRTRDTLIALADRGRIANQQRGDLFVSIHVNAANPNWREPASARGFETYFLSEARTEDARRVEAMENEAVRFETAAHAGQGDPLGFILRDMAQNEHLRESSRLAEVVQRRLGRVHPGPSRGVKQAGFKVLVAAYMPAVLVEIGYGTNPSEAAYITSADGQREIAGAVAEAVLEYLAAYDRKVQGAPPSAGLMGAEP